jgi:hypothetical protein
MATFKTVTFTDEEWRVLSMAFFSSEHRLKQLIADSTGRVQDLHRQQLCDLEELALRLELEV